MLYRKEHLFMKRKKLFAIVLSVALGVTAFSGCGKNAAGPEKETEQTEAARTEKAEQETEEASETEGIDEDDILAKLDGESFVYSSGAGAWASTFTLSADGSFAGDYHDSDMGDTGDGYPNGTFYYCDYYGQFTKPVKKNDYTYTMEIENIETRYQEGKIEIKDGVKYVYSGPAGLEEAHDIYIYLPGAPLDELPERFLEWVSPVLDEKDTTLPFYAIYNVLTSEAFLGSKGDPVHVTEQTSDSDSSIESELQKIEEKASAIQKDLSSGNLAQQEMNTRSLELYQLWDNELNSIWTRLKENLDEDTMSTLTQEERDWIKEKDSAVEAAGKEAEGGSLQPLLENDKAAEMTKERVYELAEYLK